MNLKLKASMGLMKVRKHSPAILMTVGVTGLVGTVVLASKATLSLEGIIDAHDEKIAQAAAARAKDEAGELPEGKSYTEDDAKRDKTIIYTQTAVQVVKLYLPATALGVASIAAIVSGHTGLSRRNAATMAAYASLQAGFEKYRERVREQFGEDKDKELAQPKQLIVEETDAESGETRETFQFDTHGLSVYARFFEDGNPRWQKEPGYNHMFVRSQQNYLNDRLQAVGVVFLNEAYDALGIPRCKEGQVVGWVRDNPNGDNYIDFGLDNPDNEAAREFVDGRERSILLDFNVDGVIWDYLK
jgi:hypothetical protein